MKRTTYRRHWACLSLFREWSDEHGGGGSSRVFTLKPSWVWYYWRERFMVAIGKWPPDPFWMCERWLRKNNLWHMEGADFLRAIDRYAASCPPGEYMRLQPRFLK